MPEDPLLIDVVEWIESNAVKIKTVEPNDDFSDLQPLKRILKDAQIVGLGEATHGTREFFLLKHRLIRFLIMELEFDTLAFETPHIGNINQWINGSEIDERTTLEEQLFLVWQAEEIQALIRWLRDLNLSGRGHRTDFVGMDCQLSKEMVFQTMKRLREFGYNNSQLDSLDLVLRTYFQAESAVGSLSARIFEKISFLQATSGSLANSFDAQLLLGVLTQAIQLHGMKNDFRTYGRNRDRFMAENVATLAKEERKIIVWAHNGHISRNQPPSRKTMGAYLNDYFAARYYALGFCFYKGTFTSNQRRRGEWPEYCIARPPEENIETLFQMTGNPRLFVNLRNISANENIKRWWSFTHMIQGTGANFNEQHGLIKYPVSSEIYDGLAYIEQTCKCTPWVDKWD
jgi:erythromycin esterase